MGRHRLPWGADGRWIRVAGLCSSAIVVVAGCTFDSGGIGERGSPSLEETTDSGAEAEGSTGSNDNADSGEAGDGDAAGSTSVGTSGDGADRAELDLEGGLEIDFGATPVDESITTVVTVRNVGTLDASHLSATVSDGAFAFTGGAFPGSGGDCTDALQAGDVCSLELSFTPAFLGPTELDLVIEYADDAGRAELAATLLGQGSGSSGNLLQNGDGEDEGAPPPGWTAITGPWETTRDAVPVRSGNAMLFAGIEPELQVFEARQSVDLDLYARAIESEDGLQIEWRGYARSSLPEDNEFRVVLEFRDDASTPIEQFDGGWGTAGDWESIAHERRAPAGTRSVLIRLLCRKETGNRCDAYFDDLELEVEYEPAR